MKHTALLLAAALLPWSLPPSSLAQTATPSAPAESEAPATNDSESPPDKEEPEDWALREEIVVTANRAETPRESVGSSVTVIGREEIERRHEDSVLDLLRTVPGLEVGQTGGPGGVASVFLRGANSNHTLVLLDGLRINSATSGGFDFSLLRSDQIERIEILRGPQSTLYGSEAIGGVVSITSRRGQSGRHLRFDGRFGSHATRNLSVGADGGGDSFDWSLTLADRQTDGVSSASEARGNREDDPFEDTAATARFGFALPRKGRLDVNFLHSEGETSLDGFDTAPVDDLNYVQDRRLSAGSLTYRQPFGEKVTWHLEAGVHQDNLEGIDPDTFFNNFEFESRLLDFGTRLEVALGRSAGRSHNLLLGAETERREGENVGSYEESLDVDSFFVQDSWSFDERFFVTAGLRHDSTSTSGSETTWRVTLAQLWQPRGLRLHGSYGTGFRAPAFDELYFPFAGNPDLVPETSEGFDLGLEKTLAGGKVTAGLTVFDNQFEELIQFDLSTFTFGNVARAESRGAELSVGWRPRKGLETVGTYTYTDTENESTGQPLARRPRHRLTALLLWEAGSHLGGSFSAVAVRDRIDSDGSDMDDYVRVDLSLEYRWRSWLSPYVQVENLLDEDYEEINGFTTPGLSAYAGLRLHR